MGKSKKIIILGILFLCGAGLLLFWFFQVPRIQLAHLNKSLQKRFGYSLEAEEINFSALGRKCVLKKALLIDAGVIEHPLLAAEEIHFNHPLTKLILVRPKITFTAAKKEAGAKLVNLITAFQEELSRFEVREGEIEIWKERPFEGFPLRVKQIEMTGLGPAPAKASLSFSLPLGLRSFRAFLPSTKYFPDKKLVVSSQIEIQSPTRGTLHKLSLSSEETPLFQAAHLEWNGDQQLLRLTAKHPAFSLERTHTGRWRLAGFVVTSLATFWNQFAALSKSPPLELEFSDGEIVFTDKYVFPLFSTTLHPVHLMLKPADKMWSWQAEMRMKGYPNCRIELVGALAPQEKTMLARSQFQNIPAAPFFPYYYHQIPYEKLEGTFSGIYHDGILDLHVTGPWGNSLPDHPDRLQEQTGFPTSFWVSSLQNEKGEVAIQVPFTWNWEEPLAKTLTALRQKQLVAAATPTVPVTMPTAPPLPKPKWIVKRDARGYRYLEEVRE